MKVKKLLYFSMAEVLGTTDLHTIGVVGSIPSFATKAMQYK